MESKASPLPKKNYTICSGKNNRHILIKISRFKMIIHFICTTNSSSKLSKPIAKLMVNPTAQKNDRQPNPTLEHFWINSKFSPFNIGRNGNKMGYVLLLVPNSFDKTIL
jgi:hypothetical protein